MSEGKPRQKYSKRLAAEVEVAEAEAEVEVAEVEVAEVEVAKVEVAEVEGARVGLAVGRCSAGFSRRKVSPSGALAREVARDDGGGGARNDGLVQVAADTGGGFDRGEEGV